MLKIEQLKSGYGPITALFGVDLEVKPGETLALIGANGAGKSTLLRTITGLLQPSAGEVVFEGRRLNRCRPHQIARMGVAMVPEGRRLFPTLTVEENILMGTCTGRTGSWNLETVYELFPALRERRHSLATVLSGGQQQMAAIARALMANPRLLLLDELSLGLAPIVVQGIYQTLEQVAATEVSMIIVEQDIRQAIQASDRFLCLREGAVVLAGTRAEADRDAIGQAYFGH